MNLWFCHYLVLGGADGCSFSQVAVFVADVQLLTAVLCVSVCAASETLQALLLPLKECEYMPGSTLRLDEQATQLQLPSCSCCLLKATANQVALLCLG